MNTTASRIALAVLLSAGLALAGCAGGGSRSAGSTGQAAASGGGDEYWSSEVTERILADYARCLVDGLVRYDEAEPSTPALIQRAQGDCRREENAWRQYYISQGNDRRRVNEAFSQAMRQMIDDFTPIVDDYRSRGVPLAELVDVL